MPLIASLELLFPFGNPFYSFQYRNPYIFPLAYVAWIISQMIGFLKTSGNFYIFFMGSDLSKKKER